MVIFSSNLKKTVPDRGSRSDRTRYQDHTRWTPPLPLALATPRRTPRRASAQLTSQWKTYCYGRQSILNPNPWPWSMIMILNSRRATVMTHTHTKTQVQSQSVHKVERIKYRTDRRTDGRTDAVGKNRYLPDSKRNCRMPPPLLCLYRPHTWHSSVKVQNQHHSVFVRRISSTALTSVIDDKIPF